MPPRCRRACTARISQAARRSKCALPAARRSRPRMSASRPWCSVPATGVRAPKSAPCPHYWRWAIAWCSVRLRPPCIAAEPVAFEAPSAGFALDWRALARLRSRGAGFATITLAAGISSTGDPALDARLPLDEPYRVTRATASAICDAKARGGHVIAVGTTVVRALEHSGGRAGSGLADRHLGPGTELRVVDAIL